MKFIVMFEDQPGTGMELRLKYMSAHLSFLETHSSAITAAGPLKEADGSVAGGLWLVEADTEEKVSELVEEDPFWAKGLRKSVRILCWQHVFANGTRLIDLPKGNEENA